MLDCIVINGLSSVRNQNTLENRRNFFKKRHRDPIKFSRNKRKNSLG